MNDNDIDNATIGIIAQDILKTYPSLISNSLLDGSAITAISGSNMVTSSITIPSVSTEDPLDEYIMNRVTIDHKVTAQELLKLQETAPDYASEIKESIAKNLAREVSKKISYTKKHDKDTDVHHFIGRVWVFSDDELKAILRKK